MPTLILPSQYRQQPQGPTRISRSPLARNLAFSFHGGAGVRDLVGSQPMTGRGTAQSIKPFTGGLAFDTRAVNTAAFINVGGKVDPISSDQAVLFDLVIPGAYAGTVPALGGVWRSTTQNDAMLAIERNGVDTLQVAFRIGGASALRTFSVGLSGLYGRRLTIAASIYRGTLGRSLNLRIASDGVLLYDLESTYTAVGSSDVTPTGTEYISIGSESIENPTRNPNAIIYAQHHFGRVVSAAEVAEFSANQWQLYEAPARRLWAAPAGGVIGVDLSPGAAALAVVGRAPSVAQAVNLAPGAGSMAVTGYAPTVVQVAPNNAVAMLPGSLAVTGRAPTVSQARRVSLNAGALPIQGYAPSVVQRTPVNIALTRTAIAVAGYAPTINQGAIAPPASGGGGGGPVRAVREYAKQFDRADKPTKAQKKARRRAIEAESLELLPDLPQAPLIAPQIASLVYQQTAPAFTIATPGVLVNGLPQAVMAALRLEVEAYLQQIALQEEIDDENVSELLLLG